MAITIVDMPQNVRTMTLTLTGETRINFANDYNSIAIRAENACGISEFPDKQIGDNGVLKCNAKESVLYPNLISKKYIYLIGTGTVEFLVGNNLVVNPFKVNKKGGGELITKSITENGTYSAIDDNADGYSSVSVNVSGGGSLPSTYTQLDYVNCGSGTNRQSGFTLQNYSLRANDVVEIVTTTPSFVDSEAAIFGNSNGGYEIYYNPSFKVSDYGGYFTISNTAEQIAGGLIKNTTLATIRDSVSYKPNVGFYRSGRYPYVGRMYSCRVLRPIADASGTATGQQKVLIDLVPCVRIADSTVGMFDLVYQVFYASDTGDPFTAPET